jgi:hypothetical protein
MRRRPAFTQKDLQEAVEVSLSYAETLRNLGYCDTGGNSRTIKKFVDLWVVDVAHFNPDFARLKALKNPRRPIQEVLVANCTYSRGTLKSRLFSEGLKARNCEFCGQGEQWRGQRMGLILDHINGVRDDNRLDNLRILCPNCAATLDTHCGRKNRIPKEARSCLRCGTDFFPKYETHRYCSRNCGQRVGATASRPAARRVERPPHVQLIAEIEATSYLAVGRKYGVSDNAIRKWVRAYEREAGEGEGD